MNQLDSSLVSIRTFSRIHSTKQKGTAIWKQQWERKNKIRKIEFFLELFTPKRLRNLSNIYAIEYLDYQTVTIFKIYAHQSTKNIPDFYVSKDRADSFAFWIFVRTTISQLIIYSFTAKIIRKRILQHNSGIHDKRFLDAFEVLHRTYNESFENLLIFGLEQERRNVGERTQHHRKTEVISTLRDS